MPDDDNRMIGPSMKRFENWRQLLVTMAVIAIAMLGAAPPAFAVRMNEPIVPLPATLNGNAARVEIGKRMFHDTRLSANGRVSCASCHNISAGGADSRPHSVGFGGQETGVNAPTVFNAALNFDTSIGSVSASAIRSARCRPRHHARRSPSARPLRPSREARRRSPAQPSAARDSAQSPSCEHRMFQSAHGSVRECKDVKHPTLDEGTTR